MSSSKSGLVAVLLAGLVAVSGVGSIGLGVASVYAQSSSPSSAAAAKVVINEVESNPKGSDDKGEWVELYNPASSEVSIGNFKIKASFTKAIIEIPAGTKIGAGQFYVLAISGGRFYNSAESLSLVDGSGRVVDKTPSLVDRSNDSRTWQRLPDGGSKWEFKEQTQGASNSPAVKPASTPAPGGSNNSGQANSSGMKCSGTCVEGTVVRIADPDTIYVQVGKDTYKVDLSLTKAPARNDKNYDKASSYTRDLCFGSSVLVDKDDGQKASGKNNLVGVAYCSSHNLNQELLDSKLVQIDKRQCGTSEFSSQEIGRAHV